MPTYKNDPRVIRLKWATVCRETGERLPKGSEALWYPRGGHVYGLNTAAYRQYQADLHDMAWEDANVRSWGY